MSSGCRDSLITSSFVSGNSSFKQVLGWNNGQESMYVCSEVKEEREELWGLITN